MTAFMVKVSNMASTRKQALAGQTVILTRPRESCAELETLLQGHGAQLQYLPTINILPRELTQEDTKTIQRAMAQSHYDGIAFTSARAVDHLAPLIAPEHRHTPAYSVGPATSAALKGCWHGPIRQAMPHRAAGLIQLIAHEHSAPKTFLFPCSTLARPELGERPTEARTHRRATGAL